MRGGRLDGGSRKRLGRLASGTTIGGALTGHQDPFHVVKAAPGSYNVTGSDVGLLHAWKTSEFDAGSYAVTGSDVTFINTGDAEGGGALITGEADAMGIDFTYHDDRAKQMRVTTSSVAVDSDPFSTLTYTSPSLKMCRQSDGVWRYGNHNLILRSQEFGTTWTNSQSSDTADTSVAPDGTTTADTITADAGVNKRPVITQSWTGVASTRVQASVYAKAGTHRYISVRLDDATAHGTSKTFDLQTGSVGVTATIGTEFSLVSASIVDAGSGWWRCIVVIDTNNTTTRSASVELRPDNSDTAWQPSTNFAGTETILLWGYEVKRYPVQETAGGSPAGYIATTTAARYDLPYEWDAAGVSQGILIEEQRTNLSLRSQEFGTTWSASNITVTANSTAAPDGTTTADTLTIASGSNSFKIDQLSSVSSGAIVTFSCFLKYTNHPYIGLRISDNASEIIAVLFNIQTGTVIGSHTGVTAATGTVVSSSIVDAGNGWYRCIATMDIDPGVANAAPGIYFAENNSLAADETWTAAGTETCYAWGAQLEEGSFPTSPIHTIGATVTRAVDNISLATSGFPLSATAGTLVVAGETDTIAQIEYFAALHDASTNEFIGLASDASGDPKLVIIDGGSTVADLDSGQFAANTNTKHSGAWAANDAAAVTDAGAAATDATVTLPTVTTLNIGGRNGANEPFNGHIYALTYLARRATNGELQTRTT